MRLLLTYSVYSERLLSASVSEFSSISNSPITSSIILSLSQYCFSNFSICSQHFLQLSGVIVSIAFSVNVCNYALLDVAGFFSRISRLIWAQINSIGFNSHIYGGNLKVAWPCTFIISSILNCFSDRCKVFYYELTNLALPFSWHILWGACLFEPNGKVHCPWQCSAEFFPRSTC